MHPGEYSFICLLVSMHPEDEAVLPCVYGQKQKNSTLFPVGKENNKQMKLYSPSGYKENNKQMKLYSPGCMDNNRQMKLYYSGCMDNNRQMQLFICVLFSIHTG
jgi:hypothetical protein